jgi:hypothetical protein
MRVSSCIVLLLDCGTLPGCYALYAYERMAVLNSRKGMQFATSVHHHHRRFVLDITGALYSRVCACRQDKPFGCLYVAPLHLRGFAGFSSAGKKQ